MISRSKDRLSKDEPVMAIGFDPSYALIEKMCSIVYPVMGYLLQEFTEKGTCSGNSPLEMFLLSHTAEKPNILGDRKEAAENAERVYEACKIRVKTVINEDPILAPDYADLSEEEWAYVLIPIINGVLCYTCPRSTYKPVEGSKTCKTPFSEIIMNDMRMTPLDFRKIQFIRKGFFQQFWDLDVNRKFLIHKKSEVL